MTKDELEVGLTELSRRIEPLEKFLHVFANSLAPPLYYHSGLQYFGFLYGKPDFRHFCLLKGIRAVSALNASIVLVRAGFTQELCVLLRTVVEFKSHIEYVLSERDAAGNLSREVEADIKKYFAD
jgi:hypothetical protein